jgi:Protein of unknown function (DUF2909)
MIDLRAQDAAAAQHVLGCDAPVHSTDNACMTYLVIVAFIAIIGSLVAALVFMMRGQGSTDSERATPRKNPMARALAFRVGFSIALFVLVLISYRMGWIQPTGLPMQP